MPARTAEFEAARRGRPIVTVRIGTFNAGVIQSQLTGRNQPQVLFNLNRTVQDCVLDQGLDIMNMCEVGGHMLGFATAGLLATRDLPMFHPTRGARVSITQNYLTGWGFQDEQAKLGFQEVRPPQVITLIGTHNPQLVVTVFVFKEQAKLVQGNLHIRTPSTGGTVSLSTRRRLVLAALTEIEQIAAKERERFDDAFQPIVCVLLGDSNLDADGANQAVQPLQPQKAAWEHS